MAKRKWRLKARHLHKAREASQPTSYPGQASGLSPLSCPANCSDAESAVFRMREVAMARNALVAVLSWVSSLSTRGTCVDSCFPRTHGGMSPTQVVIDHNLYATTKANGKCTGGHSYRQAEREMRPGQIAFPRTWSNTDIIRAAFLTITNPTSLRITQQGC